MPADSPVDIVNTALTVHLGRAPLATFEEVDDPTGPPVAEALRIAWPKVRDDLLVAAPWGFATKRVAPALVTAAPTYGFTRAYELPQGGDPNDGTIPLLCLRVLDTNLDPSWGAWWPWSWTTSLWPWAWSGVQGLWQIEGRTVVTDAVLPNEGDAFMIRYVARITDTSVYPPLFVTALGYELAAQVAYNITRDQNTAVRLRQEAERSRQRAISADAREGGQMKVMDLSLIGVR